MILDSTFLVDMLRGREDVSDVVEEVDATGHPFVSAVTVMELHEGIRLSEVSNAERAAVDDLLENLTELPFDGSCARLAGDINANLVEAGTPIDETDVMIAATALVHDEPVLTRNTDHFERIDDLQVRTY